MAKLCAVWIQAGSTCGLILLPLKIRVPIIGKKIHSMLDVGGHSPQISSHQSAGGAALPLFCCGGLISASDPDSDESDELELLLLLLLLDSTSSLSDARSTRTC